MRVWRGRDLLAAGIAVLAATVPTFAVDFQAETVPPGAEASPPAAPEPPPEPADLSQVRQLVRDKQYEEAERLAGELQATHPDDPALLTLRGELLIALGRASDAIEPLRRAAALAPDKPRVNFQLGTALATSGDVDGALEAFAKEITISQDREVLVLARLNRSLLLHGRGAPADAAKELEAALEIDPSRGPVYGDLVTLYLELGRIEDAVAVLERGAAAGFESARHWFTVGARLVKDGKHEQSIDPLRRAIALDPGLADAERTLGAALDHLGRGAEALEHLRRYVELAPKAGDVKVVQARIGELEKIK